VNSIKADQESFSIYYDQDTLQIYSETWAGLIILCLRNLEQPDDYQVPVHMNQEMRLEKIMQVWRGSQENGLPCQDDLSDLILNFSHDLIMYESWNGGIGAIQYYCGIMGYKLHTGSWATSDEYTPVLARMQWCMRVIMLESKLPMNDRDMFDHEAGKSPLEVFRTMRDKWLVEGQSTPFDYVHTLLNYGKKAANSASGKDHISFSHGQQVLYYDEYPLELHMWKECVHKVVEELEKLTQQLLHVSELPPVDFYSVHDSHNMKEIGHYFGTEMVEGKIGS
jgi:hypothetical protein